MKRLFIAINIPPEVKKRIEEIAGGLKVRFLPPENWHLTISFLGYQPDEAVPAILESMKKTAENFSSALVEFEKIIWAPPNKPARMIWLTGTKETSKKLDEIKNYLESNLIENGVKFQRENRPYNAHLTLARFANQSLIPFANIREFDSGLIRDLHFTVQSLDLMESHLNPFGKLRVDAEQGRSIKRTGAEYEILAKLTFLNK